MSDLPGDPETKSIGFEVPPAGGPEYAEIYSLNFEQTEDVDQDQVKREVLLVQGKPKRPLLLYVLLVSILILVLPPAGYFIYRAGQRSLEQNRGQIIAPTPVQADSAETRKVGSTEEIARVPKGDAAQAESEETKVVEAIPAIPERKDDVAQAELAETKVVAIPAIPERIAEDLKQNNAAFMVTGGTWKVDGEELVQTTLDHETGLVFGRPDWSNYDIEFEAKSTEGTHGFKLFFGYQLNRDHRSYAVGNYHNKGQDLSFVADGRWDRRPGMYVPGGIEFDRWYKLKIQVRGGKVKCFIDDELMFEEEDDRYPAGRVAFSTWEAAARFRNVVVTGADGKTLWKGVPIPPVDPIQVGAAAGRRNGLEEVNGQERVRFGGLPQGNPVGRQATLEQLLEFRRGLFRQELDEAIRAEKTGLAGLRPAKDDPDRLGVTDLLKAGTTWKGKRSYRQGAYAGKTVDYEIRVLERSGHEFKGLKFDNGKNRNRAAVEGWIVGDKIMWMEFDENANLLIDAKLKDGEIALNFNGTYRGGQKTIGDGSLAPLEESALPAEKKAEKTDDQPANKEKRSNSTYLTPPWQRLLNDEDAKVASDLASRSQKALEKVNMPEAIEAARALLQLRERVQGADHWEATDARELVAKLVYLQTKEKKDITQYNNASELINLSYKLRESGRVAKAQDAYRQCVSIFERTFGENALETARLYNLAFGLIDLPEEKEVYHRKALTVFRNSLGTDHPDTAGACAFLARCLDAKGRPSEAELFDREALDIRRRILGESDQLTVLSYSNLSYALSKQGKFIEAEPSLRAALSLTHRIMGADHPMTAMAYNNLAGCLNELGQLQDALDAFKLALEIQNSIINKLNEEKRQNNELSIMTNHYRFIENNRNVSLMNIAGVLDELGRVKEAEECYNKVIELLKNVPGEPSRITAIARMGLLTTTDDRDGDLLEQEQECRKILNIFRKSLGPDNPETAFCGLSLSLILDKRERFEEAEKECQNALTVIQTALGKDHPETVTCVRTLAAIQADRGRLDEAERNLIRAAESFARNRMTTILPGLRGASWTRDNNPANELALLLARNDKPSDAWEKLEQSFGRSTWDEIVARDPGMQVTRDEYAKLQAEITQINGLIQETNHFTNFDVKQRRRNILLNQRGRAEQLVAQLIEKTNQSQEFPSRASSSLEKIQSALSPSEAMIAWVDMGRKPRALAGGQHWAVVLRSQGIPKWTRLNGSGPDGTWTQDDGLLSHEFVEEASRPAGVMNSKVEALAKRLTAQRITPIRKDFHAEHGLPAVRHLIVLPSPYMAGVPVDLLVDNLTVSYVPSATVLSYLRNRPPTQARGVLALGDPIFESAGGVEMAAPAPEDGLLILSVIPGSKAAKARPESLMANDVLLKYHGTALKRVEDLSQAMGKAGLPKLVQVEYWRDGKAGRVAEVQSGPLEIVVSREPTARAIEGMRILRDSLRHPRARDGEKRLPGTRVEAETIAALFAGRGQPIVTLLGTDASEQKLDNLARTKSLLNFKYIHIGTHGIIDNVHPLNSSFSLSKKPSQNPLHQMLADERLYDGRLTPAEILKNWKLDAELMTLTGCNLALGKHEIGEGFIGFSQTMLIAGSRCVCLSLWNADDASTALLMARFYENLLGARADLEKPLGKSAALAEAKHWLRTLPRSQALSLAASLTSGVARDVGRKLPPLESRVLQQSSANPEDDQPPFAAPYYWANFVLVGDSR